MTLHEQNNTQNIRDIIAKAHITCGHSGALATFLSLTGRVNTPHSYKKIEEYVKNCEICQRYDQGDKNLHKMRVWMKKMYNTLGIDIIGPLPRFSKRQEIHHYMHGSL